MFSRALRSVSNNSRLISRPTRPAAAAIRPFHTPFAALGNSSLTSPPPPTSSASYENEKQFDPYADLVDEVTGTRTYVVSEPGVFTKFYGVPSGAYPTSTPYVNSTPTEPPKTQETQVSSTSLVPHGHE